MRHSFASNLIAKGANIVKVQKLLGHKSIRTTSIYLHTNIQALKKAVSTL
jgi:site-specific recombinase XerD